MNKMLRSAAALTLSACLMAGNVFAAPAAFKDVPSDFWGKTYISRAASENLISGIGEGKFGLNMPLTNAQFTTMICNMFYRQDVEAYNKAHQSSEWWLSFMAVANTKGILKGTMVGENRELSKAWSTSAVNAKISRYDMAQIMYNVIRDQKWMTPTTTAVLAAQAKISDWSLIPSKYQDAVGMTYAMGLLSGMDARGTFKGGDSMMREHGAVVMCKLLDEKEKASENIFTNTTKLVNGQDPTEENVEDALLKLQRQYGNGYVWDVSRPYLSKAFGKGFAGNSFLYMISDQVFGTFLPTVAKVEDVKAGDLVYWSAQQTYILVQSVDRNGFTYVSCSPSGRVSWDNEMEFRDISSNDAVYTRYQDDSRKHTGGTLANGDEATEKNVLAAMKDFNRHEYGHGDTWNMDKSYRSNVFGSRSVTGERAFAYYMSDEIFGELEAREVRHVDDIRVGDFLYLYDEDLYMIVSDVSSKYLTCVGVIDTDEKSKDYGLVSWDYTVRISNLDRDDEVYTRYPEEEKKETANGELADGSEATEKNVELAIEEFKRRKYGDGDLWDMDMRHSSKGFDDGRVTGDQAFAYYMSDYIFGDLPAHEVERSRDLRAGDVIYSRSDREYWMVTAVYSKDFDYVRVSSKGVVDYQNNEKLDYISLTDTIYTRYPDGKTAYDNSLTNGKAVTEDNVYDLLEKVLKKPEYASREKVSNRQGTYHTEMFPRCEGSQAFAGMVSDEVFGKLDYSITTGNGKIHVGDVVLLDDSKGRQDGGEYIIITDISGNGNMLEYATASGRGSSYSTISHGNAMLRGELSSRDEIYTRYP